MDEYGGLVYIFDSEDQRRIEILRQCIEKNNYITEDFSATFWNAAPFEIALISFEPDVISYAAFSTRKNRGNTATFKVALTDFKRLEIGFGEIERETKIFLSKILKRKGNHLSPLDWKLVIDAIAKLRPESTSSLADLEQKRLDSSKVFSSLAYIALAEEKDAIGLALSLSDFDRAEILPYWTPRAPITEVSSSVEPFLQGLDGYEEDDMLHNDLDHFGDWNFIKHYPHLKKVFQKGSDFLEITYVNKKPAERKLGVDLVYYNYHYHSYVLVQYKRMDDTLNNMPGYRPDKMCAEEVKRMRAALESYQISQGNDFWRDYRLAPNPFFFKICDIDQFFPESSSLAAGMYYSLDTWDALLSSTQTHGPRGGTIITRQNAPRYMNNTLFIQLVQGGLIGSTNYGSDFFQKIIPPSLTPTIIARLLPTK